MVKCTQREVLIFVFSDMGQLPFFKMVVYVYKPNFFQLATIPFQKFLLKKKYIFNFVPLVGNPTTGW